MEGNSVGILMAGGVNDSNHSLRHFTQRHPGLDFFCHGRIESARDKINYIGQGVDAIRSRRLDFL